MNEKTNFFGAWENVIEWGPGNDFATVTFSRQKFANNIRKLAEKYPDQVKIIADGPSNNGYLYAHIPSDWVKIKPTKKLSEEELNRLRNMSKRFSPMRIENRSENIAQTDSDYEDEEIFNEND